MVKITDKGTKAWVTFTLPSREADQVELIGAWNDWQPERMKRKKNGDYYLTRVLSTGNCYEFGFRVDGDWLCDEGATRVCSPYGTENSVLAL
jgi:1,4-alpha-glucan branching enzyme